MKIGTPIQVPSARVLDNDFNTIQQKYKKGLFIRKLKKNFEFFHLPSCKVLKRPLEQLEQWNDEKEIQKLFKKHHIEIIKQFGQYL